MLIKITNYCSMGCSHCMEDSTVKGKHMTRETYIKALDFTERVESLAWQSGAQPLILISGGEATEHPDVVEYISIVIERGWFPLLITNGMFLTDEKLKKEILRPEWQKLFIQVTNDIRFYPKKPPDVKDPRICYVDSLTAMMPLGRYVGKTSDLPDKKAPSSFNVRSLTRSLGDVRKALQMIRLRAAMGMSGHCSPSIADDGSIMAGETRNCFKVGTVDSSPEEVTKELINMRCNKCGLVNNLSQEQKRAINESVLFSAGE